MTNLRLYLVVLTLVLLASSCSTYDTFYGETDTISTFSSKSRRLNLNNNKLTTLPESTARIKSLRMLNLSGNNQLDIRSALSKLPNPNQLEVLLLDSLELKELPIEIQRFKNLKQLSLIHNPNLELESAFEIIKELPITFLNLKHNGLKSLSSNVAAIKTLKELNLSFNHVFNEETYEYLGQLPHLYSLWIDHNELGQLPKSIGRLNQIRFLYVGHNKLTEFPKEMAKMEKLWVLHSEYNDFITLPHIFIEMPSLLMVHINNNKIERFPQDYESKKFALKGLILDNNPILNTEREWAKKHFRNFFILSFEQK